MHDRSANYFPPGICAGLLWTAHGALVLAYPTESSKGFYISICWSVFNLGAVIGASVALGQNIYSKANSVGSGTYIAFLILTLIGAMLPMLMADPKMVGYPPLLILSPAPQCRQPDDFSCKLGLPRRWNKSDHPSQPILEDRVPGSISNIEA